MSYPLHFFDEMVGETISPSYLILPLDGIDKNDISEKIEDEGRKVLRALRSEFYSSRDNPSSVVYLGKILKRLLMLKNGLEHLIKDAQRTYLLMGQSEGMLFPKLSNYYCLYTNVHSFICVILLEFEIKLDWVDKETAIKSNVDFLEENDLQRDFDKLAVLLNEGLPIPVELIEVYSLQKKSVELFKAVTPALNLREKIGQIKKVKTLFDDGPQMELSEYVNEFIRKYIVLNKDAELKLFYKATFSFLKGELKFINDPKERVEFILNFMLHTNLAPDLTLQFIKEQLQLLQLTAEDEHVVTGLVSFNDQLKGIKMAPKYQKYNTSRIITVETSTLDMAFIVLNEYLEAYGLFPKDNLQQPKTDIRKEKMVVNLKKRELGILLELLFEAGVLAKPKSRTISLISEVVTLNATGEVSADDLYNQLSGWDKDEEETERVRKMLQNMVKITITKTLDQKSKSKKRLG